MPLGGPPGGVGTPPLKLEVDAPPLKEGVDAPPLKVGVDAPPLKEGVDAPPLKEEVDALPLKVGVDAPPLKEAVNTPPLKVGVDTVSTRLSGLFDAGTKSRLTLNFVPIFHGFCYGLPGLWCCFPFSRVGFLLSPEPSHRLGKRLQAVGGDPVVAADRHYSDDVGSH